MNLRMLLCRVGVHRVDVIGEAVPGSQLFLCVCRRCGKEWIRTS